MEQNKIVRHRFDTFMELNQWLKENSGKQIGYALSEINGEGKATYLGFINTSAPQGAAGINYHGVITLN